MTVVNSIETKTSSFHLSRPHTDTLMLSFSDHWCVDAGSYDSNELFTLLKEESSIRHISFHTEEILSWDSTFLTFLIKVFKVCKEQDIVVNNSGLPAGVNKLITLALAVPKREGAERVYSKAPFVKSVGLTIVDLYNGVVDMLNFTGKSVVSLTGLFTGKAKFRWSDIWIYIEECGPKALPIVSLISLLVGLILAFVGAIQLKMFGAQIYVADLVGIAMVRVMGAIMTGIIMAGRTGSAFAAQIGTMQINEEIDALETMGISPIDFLVLPRVLALTLMMPLLCVYSDVMGVLGGMFVGVTMLDLGVMEYYTETITALSLNDFWIGIFHSIVFGILVAFSGCLRGMQCGRSSSSVGLATTSAVVTGILSIVIATAIITVLCDILGI